jgi:hypothetical protein
MNGAGAVHPPSVDVGAPSQQLVDGVELSRHRRPVDRLVGPHVAAADERRLRVEQLSHLFEIVFPQRRGDRLPSRRCVELRVERLRQELLHLRVAAIARNLDRIVVYPQIQRVAIVLEQKANDVDVILTHGEVERLAIVVVRPRQRGIFCDERSYGCEIA